MKVGSGNVGINVQFLTVFVATLPNLHRYLPQRYIFILFAALGMTLEGMRLFTCLLRVCKVSFQLQICMSALESGRTCSLQELLAEVTSARLRVLAHWL